MANKYLIDTCVIIDILRNKIKIDPGFFVNGASISAIVLSELYYGANKSNDPKRSINKLESLISDFDLEILDFDQKASGIFGRLKADLELKGERLDDLDLLIASTAIIENKVLVTSNFKHFNRIKGLSVVSPN